MAGNSAITERLSMKSKHEAVRCAVHSELSPTHLEPSSVAWPGASGPRRSGNIIIQVLSPPSWIPHLGPDLIVVRFHLLHPRMTNNVCSAVFSHAGHLRHSSVFSALYREHYIFICIID